MAPLFFSGLVQLICVALRNRCCHERVPRITVDADVPIRIAMGGLYDILQLFKEPYERLRVLWSPTQTSIFKSRTPKFRLSPGLDVDSFQYGVERC